MVFNLFGNVGNAKRGFSNVFRQSLTLDDATYTADQKTLDPAQFNDVWKLRVPAQQIKTFGYGGVVGGVDDRAIVYINMKDNSATPVQIEGKVRFEVRDANETTAKVILEERSERLRGSKTDRNLAYRLAEAMVKAREDSYLVITVKPDGAATFSEANSDFVVPVTTYTL
jgi:hypothetical protein